jgi:hypothetical protein
VHSVHHFPSDGEYFIGISENEASQIGGFKIPANTVKKLAAHRLF